MRRWFISRPKTLVAILLLGVAVRLVFIWQFAVVQGDTQMYAEIARTWSHTGVYGMDEGAGPVPTYVRMPGYPAFLAAVFALGGDSPGMRPVMYLQLLVDLLTCLIIGRTALELFGERAAWTALLISAACPFTANYVALPLTETLTIFFSALMAMYAVIGMRTETLRPWIGCGAAIAGALLLRPDSGLLLAALGTYLVVQSLRAEDRLSVLRIAVVVGVTALLPLLPWTIRNWQVFHTFEPLVPRYANAPDEFVPHGYNRWIKSWIIDYVSVEEFFWKMPGDGQGEPVDVDRLPAHAYDGIDEREATRRLLQDFNQRLRVDPELDARFAKLADARIQRSPLRYYVGLPLLRMTDMWLRPRTEMLPVEVRWWEFKDHESLIAVAFGALNLAFLGAAAVAAWNHRARRGVGLLVMLVVVRTLFLGTLENPEPRYTLESYPIILALGAATFAALGSRFRPVAHAELSAEML